jgi:hypothetical protein
MLIAWALQVATGAPSVTIANRLSAYVLKDPLRAAPSKECLLPLPHLLGLVEGHRRHELAGDDRVEATAPREEHHQLFLKLLELSGLP